MKGEKKLAILGDMLELGAISIEEHLKIVKQIADSNLEVILVGAEFMKTDSSFPKFATTQELLFNIDFLKIENTLVLLKGSRGIKLEALIEHL